MFQIKLKVMDAVMDDHELASHIAVKTGELLVQVRQDYIDKGGQIMHELKDLGDTTAHDFILSELSKFRPNDSVLSEESEERKDFSGDERVWIVDPLDGTREFGEFPREDWAVHIALVESQKLVAGAVSLPPLKRIFSTADKTPTFEPLAVPEHKKSGGFSVGRKLRVASSRTRPGQAIYCLSQFFDLEILPMGSAGVKTMAVVEGIADIYAHSGGQYEWDSAAPVAVARQAGLWTSHLDGSTLLYNRPPTADFPPHFVENLIVCRSEVAPACLEVLGRVGF